MAQTSSTVFVKAIWNARFDRTIWTKLDKMTQQALLERFSIDNKHQTMQTVDTLFSKKRIPKAFAIACAFQLTKQKGSDFADFFELIEANPYDEKFVSLITYDEDGWGILRRHDAKDHIGIFDTYVPHKKALRFEQLFKSSLNLDKTMKIRLIEEVSKKNTKVLKQIIKHIEDEVRDAYRYWSDRHEQYQKEILRAQNDWESIVEHYTNRMATKQPYSNEVSTDKDGDFTPKAIADRIERSVKGQRHAVEAVSILLYYHQKQAKGYLATNNNNNASYKETLLLSGHTGSGKSFLIQTACEVTGLPYVHVDASSLVQTGIVGESVNDIVKNILRRTDYDVKKAETAVVLLDEFDKLLSIHNGSSILYQLLRMIEGAVMPIERSSYDGDEFNKIKSISTHRMCFILAGSFQHFIDEQKHTSGFIKEQAHTSLSMHSLQRFGLPKEILGRISEVVVLNELSKDDYRQILIQSDRSPLQYYRNLLRRYGNDYEPTEEEIESVINEAISTGYGARGLKQALYRVYKKKLFESPSK